MFMSNKSLCWNKKEKIEAVSPSGSNAGFFLNTSFLQMT